MEELEISGLYTTEFIWKTREIKHFLTEFHSLYIWLYTRLWSDWSTDRWKEGAASSNGNFTNKILLYMNQLESPWHEKSWNCLPLFDETKKADFQNNFHLYSFFLLIAKGCSPLLAKAWKNNMSCCWEYFCHTSIGLPLVFSLEVCQPQTAAGCVRCAFPPLELRNYKPEAVHTCLTDHVGKPHDIPLRRITHLHTETPV